MVIYCGMKYTLLISALILTSLLFNSCKKDDAILSNVPQLTFLSTDPESIQEFDGPITFTVSYQDGDGDLGENQADKYNLFLKDNRNNITYNYRLKQLAPNDANIPIIGQFNIILNSTFITSSSASEQSVTYDIYVVDRAGNKSNTISSEPLRIYK